MVCIFQETTFLQSGVYNSMLSLDLQANFELCITCSEHGHQSMRQEVAYYYMQRLTATGHSSLPEAPTVVIRLGREKVFF